MLESMHKDVAYSPGFSIKGEAREGRAAYLDLQATTPMDPRVVDAMVSQSVRPSAGRSDGRVAWWFCGRALIKACLLRSR